jgi:hypothetical protein
VAVGRTLVSYRFSGRERVTIEVDGWCDPAAVRVPSRLVLDLDRDGRARVSLFAFHVDELRVAGVPLLRWSYAEVLWRIAVRDGHTPAWWVAACDLEPRGPRFAAARLVRYPVRHLPVIVDETQLVTGRRQSFVGDLAMGIAAPGEAVDTTNESRTLLVGPDARWQVPWGDDHETARVATLRIERDSLSAATVGGPVDWAGTARVRRGRQHRCGVAEPSA